MSLHAQQSWFLTSAVRQFDTRNIEVTLTPSTERDLCNSQGFHILTALQSIRNGPTLSEFVDGTAVRFSINDIAIAQNREANLPRSSIIFTCIQDSQANKLITLLEVNILN